MNKIDTVNFVNVLNVVVLEGEKPIKRYLISEKGRFRSIRDKKVKNLKTDEIVKFAHLCFNQIVNECSDANKKNQLESLLNGLRGYLVRLNSSKRWYELILNYFGYKPSKEKDIALLASQVSQKIEYLEDLEDSKIGFSEGVAREPEIKLHLLSPRQLKFLQTQARKEYGTAFGIMKDVYHKVLGKSFYYDASLELGYESNWFSFLEDLKCLRNAKKFTPETNQTISEVINEFSFAYEVYLSNGGSKNRKGSNKSQVLHGILDRLHHLPIWDDSKPADYKRLLIPGGNLDHVMLYEVKRESTTTFSFRVMDTLSSDPRFISLEKELEDIQEAIEDRQIQMIRSVPETKLKNLKQKLLVLQKEEAALRAEKENFLSQDVCYTQLTLEQLSKEFFDQLYRLSTEKEISIEKIYFDIKKHLALGDGRNCIVEPAHRVQQKFNCETKSVTKWLKQRWGKEIHHFFKTFLTQIHVTKLENLMAQVDNGIGKSKRTSEYQDAKMIKNFKKHNKKMGIMNHFNLLDRLDQMHAACMKVQKSRTDKLDKTTVI